MPSSDLVICIVEGSAEKAIVDILLDNDMLIFSREDLVDEIVLEGIYRDPERLENDYLQYYFSGQKIIIYYILDSKKVAKKGYRLGKSYRDYCRVITAVTHPEIEILVIYASGNRDDYEQKYKTKMKPSDYVKQILRIPNIKRYDFVKDFFSDVNVLKSALHFYKKSKKNEHTIYDLIKPSCR